MNRNNMCSGREGGDSFKKNWCANGNQKKKVGKQNNIWDGFINNEKKKKNEIERNIKY